MKYACPCCGYFTYDHKPNGDFDICPVCFWEDDAVQSADPTFAGGANKVSLAEARENFLTFGACDEASKEHVRTPFEDERRAMTVEDFYRLEVQTWEAVKVGDADAFLKLVPADAVMVCRGTRCTGAEFSEEIAKFDCKEYNLQGFEIVNQDAQSAQVHYLVQFDVNAPENEDLAGLFHITTTWKCINQTWQMVFGMSARTYDVALYD